MNDTFKSKIKMTEEKKKRDIGYRIKERAKSFDSKNGEVTYTLKELIKAVHEDIEDLSKDISGVNSNLNAFMLDQSKELTDLKSSVKIYKKITIGMVVGIILMSIGQIINIV